jgi:hypothetical protein
MMSVALAPLLVAGGGIALLVLPRERPISPGELLGVGYLAGGAFVSLLSFYCGLLVGGRVLQLVVLAACAAVAAAGLARRPWPTWTSGTPGGMLLTAVPLVLALLVGWLSLRIPMAWDGVMTWEAKARLIWLGGGRLPLEVLSQPYRVHADYPLMVPMLEAWVYGWLGHADQVLVKVLFAGFFLAASWLLVTAAARLGLRTGWAAAAAVLPVCVPPLLVGEGSATSGYADFPLAACYLGAVVYLLEYLREKRREALRAAGVLAAILPWIKVEGAILWGCVVVFAGLIALHRRQLSALAWVIVPGLTLLAGWRILLLAADARYGGFLAVRPGTLLGNLPRLGLVGRALWRYATGGEWSLFWPVAALSTAVSLWTVRAARPTVALLAAAVALPAGLYSTVYIFTPIDPAFHIATSLPRLLIQVSLPAVFLILLPALAWTRRGDPEPRPIE